jgi:hypothetical protein
MKLALAVFSLFALAGCGGHTDEAAASDEADVRSSGTTLKNGADKTVDGGPLKWRVTAMAKGATPNVTQSDLATCTLTEVKSASTDKKTVFDIAIDYELDDGWNGCTIEFTAPGYKATLEIGEFIDT